ncbi:MAG TPA: hypothetical protein VHC18_24325 [Amycolatopsis sp.]|nr:hypothetical protein [Amycolatopsis sp.]
MTGSLGDPSSLGDTGSLNQGSQTGAVPPQQGQPALGMAPMGVGDQAAAAQAQQQGGGGMGGMGMMGGMGGGAGGGGGDQERGSNAYRIDGGIFNTSGSDGRISGSLDDEDDRSVSYER